jgi:hypothetical protein
MVREDHDVDDLRVDVRKDDVTGHYLTEGVRATVRPYQAIRKAVWRSRQTGKNRCRRPAEPIVAHQREALRVWAFHRPAKCYPARVNPRTNKLYGGEDRRDVPTYSIAEAAHLAQVPVSTLAHW